MKEKSMMQSKYQAGKSTMKKKSEAGIGEKLINLMSMILEEFGNNQQYEQIMHECLKTCITYASQNVNFKNTIISNATTKKNSLVKIISDKTI